MTDTGTSERSADALARYRADLRRRRRLVWPIVAAVVLAVGVVVGVAWSRGEVANTTLRTARHAPATLAPQTPATSARSVWTTTDRAAQGTPVAGGTVVVWGRHTVRGVDARTGRTTWSYTRDDRDVCTALQSGNVTVAVYQLHGNCDELTALDSGTGARSWTRTLDEDGQPVNGPASYQITPYTVVVASATAVYAIDPTSGIDRWVYSRFGCTVTSAVLGTSGALISQTCGSALRCGQRTFCGPGRQLLLRDPSTPTDDKGKNPKNYDRILWNRLGDADVPVSADGVVSALNPTTRALDVLDASKGAPVGSVVLTPAPAASGPITAVASSTDEIVSVRGVVAALAGGTAAARWSTAAAGPVTAVPGSGDGAVTFTNARLTVPTSRGADVLDTGTGRVTAAVTLSPAPAAGSAVYPLGAGQLVAGPAGTVAYA